MPLGFRLRHCGMCVRVVSGVVETLIAALKVQGFAQLKNSLRRL